MKSSVRISRGVENLFGTRDENIRLIEAGLGVQTHLLDNNLEIEGEPENVTRAANILEDYNTLLREGHVFNNGDLNSYLRVVTNDREVSLRALVNSGKQRNFGKKVLAPKTVNQRRYLEAIERNDLVFGLRQEGAGAKARQPAPLPGNNRAQQPGLRHRPRRYRQDLPRRRHGHLRADEQTGGTHRPDPSRGGSRRAPGIPARHLAGKGGPLPAPALRCPLRHAG